MAGVHAKKGPSGAKRLHACPGALALVDTIPPELRKTSGPAAQLGTAAHFLLETCLTNRKPPEDYRGRIIVLLGDKEDGSMLRVNAKEPDPKETVYFIVDDDIVFGVTMAYEYVLRRLASMPRAELLLESKTNPVPDREDTWGTADVTIDEFLLLLEVVDYKNGRNLVEHRDNPQLLSYLAGRAHDTGWSHDKYMITIVQPFADHEEGRIRSFDISREDLMAFVDKHRQAAEMADEAADVLADQCHGRPEYSLGVHTWADVYLHAGEEQCKNCEAAETLRCPAYKLWVKAQAKMDFDADPPDESPEPSVVFAADVLRWSPYILTLIKNARSVEFRELQSGRVLPGRKAVRLKPRGRKLKPGLGDAYSIAAKLVKGGFVNDNERSMLFTEPELLSGPKIEKLISTKKVADPADDEKKISLRQLFAREFLYLPEGRIVSAPLDDPRPAVSISAASDFDDEPLEDPPDE